MSGPLLSVSDLRVAFPTEDGVVQAVAGVSYDLAPGEALGVVGESGSGKSVSVQAIIGLTRGGQRRARISGSARFDGTELVGASERELRHIRGAGIGVVFQDPLSSLHPFFRVGRQLTEAIHAHRRRVTGTAARAEALELLDRVGLRDPSRVMRAFPHELSGGMRQRVMIAIALANGPRLLIADEPTTALDVTVQAQILDLLDSLRRELGMALILISHDLGVVAQTTDTVAVMYAGRIIEHAPTRILFAAPEHPYTWGLLASLPDIVGKDADLVPIAGAPPSLISLPSGCPFHPRCPYVDSPEHMETLPELAPGGTPDHRVACLLSVERRRQLWRERTHPAEARR